MSSESIVVLASHLILRAHCVGFKQTVRHEAEKQRKRIEDRMTMLQERVRGNIMNTYQESVSGLQQRYTHTLVPVDRESKNYY